MASQMASLPDDVKAQLRAAKELHDEGLIDDDVYSAKQKQLLGISSGKFSLYVFTHFHFALTALSLSLLSPSSPLTTLSLSLFPY
jgi:hypothetical protein